MTAHAEPDPKTAVIFRTHFWDAFAERQFKRLLDMAAGTDVFVLVDETKSPVAIAHDRIVSVTEQGLLGMGLAKAGEGNLLWFNGDYPLYRFLDLHPDYDYYLQLEYDVRINRPVIELIRQACAEAVDYIGQTEQDQNAEWFWNDSCRQVYEASQLRHQLICLSVFSRRALRHLRARRLEMSKAYEAGALTSWPFCEAFIPTELMSAHFVCRELASFGDIALYDHWPPYLEADADRLGSHAFIHPVLDQPRYASSLLKYKVGVLGYLNPVSLFHRKLRRLPAPYYLSFLASSFSQKAQRSLHDVWARLTSRPGLSMIKGSVL